LSGFQVTSDQELCILRRMWCCWWPQVHSGRCIRDSSVSTWNFKQYWNSSVISWSHHPIIFSQPPTQEKRAYLLANVFSGSVATKLKW